MRALAGLHLPLAGLAAFPGAAFPAAAVFGPPDFPAAGCAFVSADWSASLPRPSKDERGAPRGLNCDAGRDRERRQTPRPVFLASPQCIHQLCRLTRSTAGRGFREGKMKGRIRMKKSLSS